MLVIPTSKCLTESGVNLPKNTIATNTYKRNISQTIISINKTHWIYCLLIKAVLADFRLSYKNKTNQN